MKKDIIIGSEKWIRFVPNEYAIECVERYISPIDKNYEIYKFYCVQRHSDKVGEGFVRKCVIAKLPFNIAEFIEGIIICQHDVLNLPSIYYKRNNDITYEGILNDCEVFEIIYKKPKFSKIFHYSERTFERQKTDELAPEWLKKFSRDMNNSNVAYFEF